MALPPLRLAPGQVRVWHARMSHLAADPARMARWLTWLQPPERARYDRYRFDADRLMFLGGRVMARALVARATGLDPATWRWREGPHGRPEIDEPGVTVHFNLAHSADLVVCALADCREIGVDVEDRHRRPVDPALVSRYCSPSEVADIAAQPPGAWQDRFLLYWTLKEAYLKARGLGISVQLADVSFALDGDAARISLLGSLAGADTRWSFSLQRPTDRHILALAASTADGVRPAFELRPLSLADLDD